MRALTAAAAVTALGAIAVAVGVATQPAVPTSPVVLAADVDIEDQLAEIIAELLRSKDPSGWDSRYGDGTHD